MKARKVNEGIFDDPANKKAMAGWANMRNYRDPREYEIEVLKPFKIVVTKDEKDQLEFILNKYRIAHEVQEMTKSEN